MQDDPDAADPTSAEAVAAVAATFCATLVDEWVRAGLTDAVVCPGSRSTPLALALADDARVRVHVHHDERSGSFLAVGLGAVTGRPAVVLCTSGTAAVEMHAAVVEADLAGVPMIVCTADRPPELRDVAAPQAVDQQHLYGRSVRWFTDPGVPEAAGRRWWRSLAARAWVEAQRPWPGPVHLNLPFREPLVGTAGPLPEGRGDGPWHHRAVPSGSSGTMVDPELAGARGVVVAGRATPDPDAVLALAAQLGWPVLADPTSGCRRPGTVAAFDALLRTPFAARNRPEVVLRSGALPASKVLTQWLAGLDGPELVVAPAPLWPDPSRRAAVLLDHLPVAPPGIATDPAWRAAWVAADAAAQAAIDEVVAAAPLSEPAVARHLTAVLPPGAALVASSSMPIRDIEWFGRPRADIRVLSNRGANGIDGVVSTAVGVAAAGVRTTLLIGDVAFLHDVNGLLGLPGRSVDLTVVVLDNDGGGIFSFLPQRASMPVARFEQLFGTPHGLDLVAVASAYGLPAVRVSSIDELRWQPGSRVLVVPGDREANVAVHRRLDAAVSAALG